MATTFNFTVRAEDDQGAFADRDFSMTVRNTMVDRYLVTTATDAYTSPDMVNWTKRVSQGGTSAQYGGGKWLIMYNTTNYRLSADGISFTTHTLPSSTSTGTLPVWLNDRWVYASQVSSSFTVYQSFDGLVWESLASVNSSVGLFTQQTPSYYNGEIYFSYISGSSFVKVNIEEKTANIITLSLKPTTGTGVVYSAPYRFNDLWVSVSQSNTSCALNYSTDFVNWNIGSTISGGAGLPVVQRVTNLFYNNGVITGTVYVSTTNRPNAVLVTRDGKNGEGVTVQANGLNSNTKQLSMVTKGKLYIITNLAKAKSSDLGATWEEATGDFPNDLGSTAITGIAAIQ